MNPGSVPGRYEQVARVGQGVMGTVYAAIHRFVVVGQGSQVGAIAFGRGALDCRDLYVASGDGPLQRVRVDTPGYARS